MTTQQSSNYTSALADFAAKSAYNNLPSEIIHETKRLILDVIACCLGACSSETGNVAIRAAKSIWGSGGESTIIGSRIKSSIAGAAFTNGQLANAMDADECFFNFCHIAGSVFPAALAVAEGMKAGGRELLAAMAVGYEVAGRIGLSLPRAQALDGDIQKLELKGLRTNDWAWQVFGAATAAGKLLGFDGPTMAHAYGIAGFNAPVADTSALKGYDTFLPMTKYSMLGTNALIGVIGALLAESGFTGNPTILDGENGFYDLIGVERLYPEMLTEKLGENWMLNGVSYKRYPACRIIHPAVDVFYELIEKNNLAPDDIQEVFCKLHPRAFGHLDKWPVDSIHDGLGFSFCFPMTFALAAYGVEPGPDWHSGKHVNDERVKAFAKRVRLVPDPDVLKAAFAEVGNEPRPVKKIINTLEITTVDGRVYTGSKEYARGDPWDAGLRFNDEDLADKVRVYGKAVLRTEKIEALIRAVYELEKIKNLQKLCDLLIP
jgi:2-methylcitrate dehydratase PrpD